MQHSTCLQKEIINMLVKKLFLFSTVALYFSCSNNADTTAEPFDTTLLELPSEEVAATPEFQTSFASVYAYLKTQDSSFASSNFELSGNSKLDTSIKNPIKVEQLQAFYPCFIFNADSSMAIDLYSYNYTITPAGRLDESGPDTEVGLIDFKNNTRRRIFFSGPAATIVDAAWQKDGKILLAGAEMVELEKMKPFQLSMDIYANQVETFNYRDTLSGNFINFKNNKCSLLQL